MSRYFMYGTSLGEIAQLMMLAPNFPQRRSGIVINNHFNCKGGIIVGKLRYRYIARATFLNTLILTNRLHNCKIIIIKMRH